jgi:hypothetical protein
VRGVLGRIVRDEAAHGSFGWSFLDWAADELSLTDRQHLARVAGATIDALTDSWKSIHGRKEVDVDDIHALGWMDSEAYLALAKRSLRAKVLEPLRARGIDPECSLPDGV